MNVTPKIRYTMEFNQRELKMLRRALELEGSIFARELSGVITRNLNKVSEELKVLAFEISKSEINTINGELD